VAGAALIGTIVTLLGAFLTVLIRGAGADMILLLPVGWLVLTWIPFVIASPTEAEFEAARAFLREERARRAEEER
jgi:urea transporter